MLSNHMLLDLYALFVSIRRNMLDETRNQG